MGGSLSYLKSGVVFPAPLAAPRTSVLDRYLKLIGEKVRLLGTSVVVKGKGTLRGKWGKDVSHVSRGKVS